jgi:hypothetical protein
MFYTTTSFNQDLSKWMLPSCACVNRMFSDTFPTSKTPTCDHTERKCWDCLYTGPHL